MQGAALTSPSTPVFLRAAAMHVGVGVAVLGVLVLACLRSERETVGALKSLVLARRGGKGKQKAE